MKTLWRLLTLIMLVTPSACETMHGLGKDVEDAGEWLEEKAS